MPELPQDSNICKVCGAPGVVRKVIDETFTYEGQSAILKGYIIYDCANCGEAIADPESVKRIEPLMQELLQKEGYK